MSTINATTLPEYVTPEWEYYYDYVSPPNVDETKLKFNKYSVVIMFWVGMAGFVVLLFIILLHLSRSGNTHLGHNSKKSCLCCGYGCTAWLNKSCHHNKV